MLVGPPQKQFHAHGAGAILFRWLEGRETPPKECMIVGPAGTGKSINCGHFLWGFIDRWGKGAKVLVLRKTRVSLNESFLDTFENEILYPGHPSIGRLSRDHRTKYVHPNGGELVLGGMDQGRRLFSTQYHIIYVNEMTELTEKEWMSLHRALRRPGGPGWHLLLGDANPDAEFHWANRRFPDPAPLGRRRALQGGRERILSFHRDNPMYATDPAWREYLVRLDTQLVGHTRDRLFLGKWMTAAGLVYAMWNPHVHLQTGRMKWPRDAFGKVIRGEGCTLELPDLGVATSLTWFGASMDFGHTAPGCFQVWGHDQERRSFRVAEVYRSGKTIDWWAEWIADLYFEFRFRFISCDSASPEPIERLNDHLAKRGVPKIAKGVVKPTRKLAMFNAVREGMRLRTDGFPSIVLIRDALRGGRDPDLDADKKACCTEEEVGGLVIRTPRETERGEVQFEEEDPACPNHGCDAMGYEQLEAWGKDLSKKPAAVQRLVQESQELLKESAYDLARRERRNRRRLL